MKYLDEYRDAVAAKKLVAAIRATATRRWTIMEVCGGQTHGIIKYAIDQLLEDCIELIHGPGCPVCVTPLRAIDRALAIAARPEVIFCSFGDMLRVPGSEWDLLRLKAGGADIRIVYSPLDSLKIAQENPHKEIVFFGVGFETTAPATALAAYQAKQLQLANFSLLISHVCVPPVLAALLSAENCRVQGFLLAGHVCAVMGYHEYPPLAARYRTPMAVAGFEPLDILQGLWACVQQLEQGRCEVINAYGRVVKAAGNAGAQNLLRQVFTVVDRSWRGLGVIPASGLALHEDYAPWDAERRFTLADMPVNEPQECLSGEVLQGHLKPDQCSAFATRCTPEHPLGATMVSSEGACAAYYRYRRQMHG